MRVSDRIDLRNSLCKKSDNGSFAGVDDARYSKPTLNRGHRAHAVHRESAESVRRRPGLPCRGLSRLMPSRPWKPGQEGWRAGPGIINIREPHAPEFPSRGTSHVYSCYRAAAPRPGAAL